MVFTIRYFRIFGDVECEDFQSRILYKDIYTVYTLTKDETTNSHTGAPYVLAESMSHTATVTLLEVMFVTNVVNKQKNVHRP